MNKELIQALEKLEAVLAPYSIRQLADIAGVGASTVYNILKKKSLPPKKFAQIYENLCKHFAENEEILAILHNVNKLQEEAQRENEEEPMILRKQNLSQAAKIHFSLIKNPLADPRTPDELYFNKRSRFIRECLLDAAMNGNFLALVGESGRGKSTLRMELIENLKRSDKPVIVIEPYTLSMFHDSKQGTLKTRHLLESILQTLAPSDSIPTSPQILAKRVHKKLLESHNAGFRHCLIIEEAHDMSTNTLKALKRFWELSDGMERLLSIILIGQPELSRILGTNATEVREVVQRCDVVELGIIDDIEEFLAFKFKKAKLDVLDFFEKEALQAISEKLHIAQNKKGEGVFYSYPLAIVNLATASLNKTAELGFERVNADIVAEI